MLVKKMLGFLLLSFRVIGIRLCEVYCMISCFVVVFLVNVILVMWLLEVNGLLVLVLNLLIMLIILGGNRLLISDIR